MPAAAQPFCNGVRCTYTPLERLPGQTNDTISTPQQFGDYVGSAFRLFIVLGGMLAVATFVFGGITYMVSDVLDKKDFARRQMQRSVYGILLLLGSYLLLVSINPEIGLFKFNPGEIPSNFSNNATPGSTVFSGQPTDAERAACEGASSESAGGRVQLVPGAWQCVPR